MNAIAQRLWRLPLLAVWATGAIAVASLQVARDIIKPSAAFKPGIVIVPVYLTTSTQLAVWVSLINLTPGTRRRSSRNYEICKIGSVVLSLNRCGWGRDGRTRDRHGHRLGLGSCRGASSRCACCGGAVAS